MAFSLDSKPVDDVTCDLFAAIAETRSQRRKRELRDEIVALHLGLADRLARRYWRGDDADQDIFQVACLALTLAVERFDPTLGTAFSSFARVTIRGEIKRYFRDNSWAVRPPRSLQEVAVGTRQTEEDLRHKLGREPSVTEVANESGVDVQMITECRQARQSYRAESLDSEEGEFHSRQFARNEGGYDRLDTHLVLQDALAKLTIRERRLLKLRFELDLTQEEIGSQIGVSQMQVSRLLRSTLASLKGILADCAPTA